MRLVRVKRRKSVPCWLPEQVNGLQLLQTSRCPGITSPRRRLSFVVNNGVEYHPFREPAGFIITRRHLVPSYGYFTADARIGQIRTGATIGAVVGLGVVKPHYLYLTP